MGKRTWQPRTSPPFDLVAGRTYTLQFNSLSPFWYQPDGGLGGIEDRTTFIDQIVFGAFDGGTMTDGGAVLDGGGSGDVGVNGGVDGGAEGGEVDSNLVDGGVGPGAEELETRRDRLVYLVGCNSTGGLGALMGLAVLLRLRSRRR